MIKNFVNDIGGIQTFGIISICLFGAVFVGAFLWACSLKKSVVKSLGDLPLHDEEILSNRKGTHHE